jgi:uncharacterized membrane protein YdfJ with MMPL/SSD domain
VAGWSAHHRWPVVGLWFFATIGLFVVSLLAGGTRAQDAVTNDERSRYEAGKAYVVFNASGQTDVSQQFLLIVSTGSGSVDDPSFAEAIDGMITRLRSVEAEAGGTTGPTFTSIVHPLMAPPQAGLVSPDRTAVRIVARIPGDGPVLEQRLAPVPAVLEELRVEHPALRIDALNNTLANREISELVNSDLDGSLTLTIPLTFLILLVAFGAVVAALVPLVMATTSLLAAFGILGLYSQFVGPVSPYASQLIVLIGLAVAVDYSLFMITRFRSERRRHGASPSRPAPPATLLRRVLLLAAGMAAIASVVVVTDMAVRIAAGAAAGVLVIVAIARVIEHDGGEEQLRSIETASSTAGRAVFFSGLAVIVSIAGLFLLDDPLFRSMAIGTIAVVFIAVVGSLTFLPAVLAILGNGLNAGRVPILGRERPEGQGFWGTLVRFAMRRPKLVAAVTAGALLLAASPVLRLHFGQSDFSSFPDSLKAVQAVNLLDEKWPGGSTMQLQVVVTAADKPATKAAVERLGQRLVEIDGLSGPIQTRLSKDEQVVLVSTIMAGTRNDHRNHDIVREVRRDVVPAVFAELPGVEAYVTGDAAFVHDSNAFYTKGMPFVFLFVLGLAFLLLLVAFHSIVIPIKSILLNLLSTGAAYGLLVLVFQEGWLAGILGFKPAVIEAFVPVFIFTILFGLSMDYHLFILTRVKEARDRGLDSNRAVERGITITSGTITSAAAIMIVVFSVFVTLQLVIIRQLGFGLAVAVFIDATIVRSLLLPATMRLLGEWNWWMPRALAWVPRITIEGETEEPEEPEEPDEPSSPAEPHEILVPGPAAAGT